MFALIAAIILFLTAFGVLHGGVNWLLLALAFWALHFAFSWTPWTAYQRRPQ